MCCISSMCCICWTCCISSTCRICCLRCWISFICCMCSMTNLFEASFQLHVTTLLKSIQNVTRNNCSLCTSHSWLVSPTHRYDTSQATASSEQQVCNGQWSKPSRKPKKPRKTYESLTKHSKTIEKTKKNKKNQGPGRDKD